MCIVYLYDVELYNVGWCPAVRHQALKLSHNCRELMLLSMTIRWVRGPAAGGSLVLSLLPPSYSYSKC